MKTIILIACVASKGGQKAKAKDLYISPLFKYSLQYAQSKKPDHIFILSALHHLLDLETELEPYNVTLSKVPKGKIKPGLKVLSKVEKELWGKEVIAQLYSLVNLEKDQFIFLAGQEYIKPLMNHIRYWKNDLEGLPPGKRLVYLKSQISKPAAEQG